MADKGLVMPNRQWEAWRVEDLVAVADLQPALLEVLVYDRHIEASIEKMYQLLALVVDCPSVRRIQFRPFDVRIPKRAAVWWARECWRRVQPYLSGLFERGVRAELLPANEGNLDGEGGHQDWELHVFWLLRFAEEWRCLEPTGAVALHLPAYSPGLEGYSEGWRAWAAQERELREAGYRFADAHCYAGDRSYELLHRIMPEWTISITEFNGTDPKSYLEGLPKYVHDASWFILAGEEDQRLYWLLGSPLYESFRGARVGVGVDGVDDVDGVDQETGGGHVVGLKDEHPELYREWIDQGGEEEAFRAHLLGIGALVPRREDVQMLRGRHEATLAQLMGVVDRLISPLSFPPSRN